MKLFNTVSVPSVNLVLGQDYDPVMNPLQVQFVAGVDGQGDSACANITILDDDALEGPHNFSVILADFDLVGGTPDTARIFMGTPSSASVLMEDNEGTCRQDILCCTGIIVLLVNVLYFYYQSSLPTTGVTLGFVQPAVDVFENQSIAEVCVYIFNIPTGGLECDVEATIGFGGGAKTSEFHVFDGFLRVVNIIVFILNTLYAVLGVDFTAPSTRVKFPALTTPSGDQQCVNISIIDDTIVEGQQLIVVQFDTGNETPMGQIDFNPSASVISVVDNDGNFCILLVY